MVKNLSKFLMGLISSMLLFSCNHHTAVFDEYKALPNEGWHRDSAVSFTTLIEDTMQSYNIILRVKYSTDYPLSNLYLLREISSKNEVDYQDTINITMFDPRGKITGKGISSVREHEIPVGQSAVRFGKRAYYDFKIKHIMRDSLLPGIEFVGMKIEPFHQ